MLNMNSSSKTNNENLDIDKQGAGSEDIKSIKNDIKSIGESLSSIFDSLMKKITFTEYLDTTSEYIDEQIINISKSENLIFVAGNCFLNCPSPYNYVFVRVELYFKDTVDRWIKKVLNGKARTAVFEPAAQKKEIEMLKAKEMKIGIDPPKV